MGFVADVILNLTPDLGRSAAVAEPTLGGHPHSAFERRRHWHSSHTG